MPEIVPDSHDTLTRIAGAAVDTIEAHPEFEPEIRAVVLLNNSRRGGIGLSGYEPGRSGAAEAIAELLIHARAIADAYDLALEILPTGSGNGH